VQAHYEELSQNWKKAIETYQTLFQFFPDNLEYGLALAHAQFMGGDGRDSLETVTTLRRLPPPLGNDPRIDLAEADAFGSLGDLKNAVVSADRAAGKARVTGASLLLARAQTIRAPMLRNLGRLDEAGLAVNESKQIFEAAGDKDELARSEAQAATLLSLQGDFATAKKMYGSSLATFREIGDREGVAREVNNIADEDLHLGALDGARRHFEEALSIWSELRNRWGIALAEANLGETYLDLGDLVHAKKVYEESISVAQALSNTDLTAYDLAGLGRVLQAEGNLTEAEKNAHKAVFMFEEVGQKRTDAYLVLSHILLDMGRAEDAAISAQKAIDSLGKAKLGDRAGAEAVLAQALLAQGKLADARRASEEASFALGSRITAESNLFVATVAARVRAASSNPVDRAEGAKSLQKIVTKAKQVGFVPEEFEARLALAETEIASGDTATGRALLQALQKDASRRGFNLLARKSAAITNSVVGAVSR
jgi:tetratricopeptide (TPR) repeat protein